MLIVSSREFREKQKSYLDKVDEGVEVLIHRGKNKSYKIIPVSEEDTITGKDDLLSPDEELVRAITGEELLKRLMPRIEKLFDK